MLFSGQNLGGGAAASSSSYESASFGAGAAGASSYESASFGAGGAGFESAAYESSASSSALAGAAGASGAEFNAFTTQAGFAGDSTNIVTGATTVENVTTTTQVQQYATDAQGLFKDPNPQIIRRAATGGVQTYTQNIKVRFLQPPPVPPPGVS